MCLGIPGRVVAITDPVRLLAVVDFGSARREVSLACVVGAEEPPESCVGAWVLVHAGFARSRIDEAEARRTLAVLQELVDAQQEIAAQRGRIRTG